MPQQEKSHKIIYMADDDEDDRMLFLDAVDELGIPVKLKQAEDGQRLLDILYRRVRQLPEIIFLDINMPAKNGFECLREIRGSDMPFRNLKVIMLSTSGSAENIELSYELGADFYAVKPNTFQGLKDLLHNIITMDWSRTEKDRAKFRLA